MLCNNEKIKFRKAVTEDAYTHAHILNRSWKDTYGDYISVEHIDKEFNIEELIQNFEKHISNTTFEVYMIEYENQTIGILEVGSPDEEDIYKENLENFGEIRRFYINKEYQKKGFGTLTIHFAFQRLKELGFKNCFLWVKRQNEKAIKFYEKNDFKRTRYTCETPSDGAPSFVMEKVFEGRKENMKSFNEMWEELSPYLKVERGLDEGYADGKYTRFFARYCKQVDGIDISEDFYKQAKENLKDVENVNLQIIDAVKTPFADKSYDVVLCTSFHEFDLSGKEKFTMDLKLKTNILKEMMRLSNTLVFAEISPTNISGELYKVFNPIEDHSFRTEVSNLLIDKVLRDNGYKRIIEDYAVDEIPYNSKEEFLEDMIDWWKEVKVPKDEEEKNKMKNEIATILETENMLTDLTFHDVFRYTVYIKE